VSQGGGGSPGPLEPVFYLLYTADLSVGLDSTTTTYAEDTAILVAHNNHLEASLRLQENLHHIQRWLKRRRYIS